MRRVLAITLGFFIALASLAVLGSAAMAQGAGPEFETKPAIVAVNDSQADRTDVVVFGVPSTTPASEMSLEIAGDSATISGVEPASEAGWPTELIFVVDVHNRGVSDGAFNDTKLAMASVVEGLSDRTSVGIVTAGSTAQTELRRSSDRDRIVKEIQALQPEPGAAIFDGVDRAGRLFGDGPNVVRSVVVFAGGSDTASNSDAAAATTSLIQSGAQLVVVHPDGTNFSSMTGAVGGVDLMTSETVDVMSAAQSASLIANDRLLVSFAAEVENGVRQNVTLKVGGESTRISYPAGLDTTNILQLAPQAEKPLIDLGFLGTNVMLYLFIGMAFIGISLGIWSVGSMFAGQSDLDSMLARYDAGGEGLKETDVNEMLVQNALVQRAVDMSESFAQKRGFLSRIERLLERANLPIRAGEAFFFAWLLSFVVFIVVWFVGRSFLFAVLFSLASIGIAYGTVQFLARHRLKKFEGQLPDTLQLLAGTLRAGYSLPQGLESVSQEISDPMGEELRRAMSEAQLGRELEEALAGVAERLDSPDFAWAIMAIGIQREVGGNLSELLMTVSETMIQRERLRREVNALTAEGRMSAMILSLLPPGLGLVMWVMNPDYIGTLFESTIGWIMVGLAIALGLVGLAWMKKVITIDA